ncbi:MAG TPA: patatin-like phospholipase family protein [Polyangiaceae bacterium]|nr:patatin-like phospholipase family protein [Polyangiaceae bacterium]
MNDEKWGHLAGRYSTRRPRRLLALDGGGIRGILTLQFLQEIERQLRLELGRPQLLLCDYFDYIGGTSTGGIIAAALSCGMSTADLITFYRVVGPEMFAKENLVRRLKNLYKSGPLEKQLMEVFGADTTLASEKLRCLLLVVTRNATTDSPWPISTNPCAKYNDSARADDNRKIPLWKLVRASTAAPIFFPPEVVSWDPATPDKTFVFVDGGVTPYNNPAFLLYRMATMPEYQLGWQTGEDRLMLVSVGTGAAPTVELDLVTERNALANLGGLPSALMYGAMVDQDTSCRAIGRCVAGAMLDRELGDLVCKAPLEQNQGRAMLYARYNADLSEKGLIELNLGQLRPADLQALDSVEHIDDLISVGYAAAQKQVKLREQFGSAWMSLP